MSYPGLLSWVQLTRLDRPIGTLLLGIPMILAFRLSPPLPWTLQGALLILCLFARTLGCLINDYADRDIDKHVTRTQNRPLTQGHVTPLKVLGLIILLTLFCASCFLILPYRTYPYCLMAPIWIGLYSWAKRWCPAPQILLAIAFSWSILIVAKISFDTIPTPFYHLFLANMLWVSGFDTTYAFSDLPDDLKLPIYSLPKTLGCVTSQYFAILTLLLAQILLISIYSSQSLLLCSSLLVLKIAKETWELHKNPMEIFKSHGLLGLIWILETHDFHPLFST